MRNKSLIVPALRKCEGLLIHTILKKKMVVSVLYSTAATMSVGWLLNPPKESTRHESKLITRSSTVIIPVHVKLHPHLTKAQM